MTVATEVFEQIKASAESIKNDETQQFPEAASIGDKWRQGDIYVERVDETFLSNCKSEKCKRQLAPGTTKGSRHILDCDVEMFAVTDANPLFGPVFRCDKQTTITHPEHGDVKLQPGTYRITYQRAFAEELKRALD